MSQAQARADAERGITTITTLEESQRIHGQARWRQSARHHRQGGVDYDARISHVLHTGNSYGRSDFPQRQATSEGSQETRDMLGELENQFVKPSSGD